MVTKEQFMRYYKVQMCGAFNMFDPRAREMTGLDKGTYFEIIRNYGEYYRMYVGKR